MKTLNRVVSLLAVGLATALPGCARRSDGERTSLPPEMETNAAVRHYLETNAEARHFFESFTPEIERNEKVQKSIKDAVATSTDPKVTAFHQFLSHWHLRWPVVKQGAFGEGGIGFAWYKHLQK